MDFQIQHRDYLYQEITFPWPVKIGAGPLTAEVHAVQPCGFKESLAVEAVREKDRGRFRFFYPLIDDGTFDPPEPGEKLWRMGEYRFDIRLTVGDKEVGRGSLSLDPNDFFGRIEDQKLAQVDSLRQLIECCPDRPVFIGSDNAGFSIRTIPDRVERCEVVVDAVCAGEKNTIASPLKLTLDGHPQKQAIDIRDWPTGESWIRVRVLRNGTPTGPFLVRKLWKEVSFEIEKPELPLFPGDRSQYMVDDWIFSSCKGLRHEPDQLEWLSSHPVVRLDKPWESRPKLVHPRSFSWDEKSRRFRMTYFAGPVSEDSRLREKGAPSMMGLFSSRYLCLAVSSDGVEWEKPELGLVSFQGSKKNNILRDTKAEDFLISGEFDSYPYRAKERPIPRKYRYRYYDPQTDGPTDMDRFVFRAFSGRNLEPDDQFVGDFHPARYGMAHSPVPDTGGTFWGFERRGNTFLTLTRDPVLSGGNGMSLDTTTERASTYPFEGEMMAFYQVGGRSTGTFYDRASKTFFYFFRPSSPPYPPNGLPCYLWHGAAQIRSRAVMWTRDGVHWKRRYMLSPDEHDVPGTTLYGFGLLRQVGRDEGDAGGHVRLGTLHLWDLRTQQARDELVWSRDLIHWHRFGANRKFLLPSFSPGSFGFSTSELTAFYPVKRNGMEEEWWFPCSGGNNRYMLSFGLASLSLDELKATCPYYSLAPFFTSWEDFHREIQNAVALPGLARCRAGRLAHVEPEEGYGEFTTHPLVLDGGRLLVNARTQDGGSVAVEVMDGEGNVFPGLSLSDCLPFSGDETAHEIRWRQSRIEEMCRRVIRLRFVLREAKLYTFRIGA